MTGYLLALCSVILVSLAQILLKLSLLNLPAGVSPAGLAVLITRPSQDSLLLAAGLTAYILSMGFWFFALKRLPLSRACALLSLSYILVRGLAIILGLPGEAFSLKSSAGILLVIAGVILVCRPGREKTAGS